MGYPPEHISVEQLQSDLLSLGVAEGVTLVVHTSLRNVGWVDDGPEGVIKALRGVLGPTGTLAMPSMTDRRVLYDPKSTPTINMGIVAETFWRMPGVLRSLHPNASFSAQGPLAYDITYTHPVEDPEGIDSPIGKVFKHDGWVLLLGVDHDANTTIHLGEALSKVPYRIVAEVPILENGRRKVIEVPFIDHCCGNFVKVGPYIQQRGLVRIGNVGKARSQLMKSRDMVQAVCELLKQDRYFFLCPPDKACPECDRARAYVHG